MSTAGATTSPGLEPDLDRARELARVASVVPVRYTFIDDCETPVSAFLKLRGEGPAFLLESAEQGRLGRYSFLGFRPRAILRWQDGRLLNGAAGGPGVRHGTPPDRAIEAPDPYGAVADYLGRYEIAEPDTAAAVRRAGRSASSGTTSSARWSRSESRTPIRSGSPTWR